jgi:hypothetical protein
MKKAILLIRGNGDCIVTLDNIYKRKLVVDFVIYENTKEGLINEYLNHKHISNIVFINIDHPELYNNKRSFMLFKNILSYRFPFVVMNFLFFYRKVNTILINNNIKFLYFEEKVRSNIFLQFYLNKCKIVNFKKNENRYLSRVNTFTTLLDFINEDKVIDIFVEASNPKRIITPDDLKDIVNQKNVVLNIYFYKSVHDVFINSTEKYNFYVYNNYSDLFQFVSNANCIIASDSFVQHIAYALNKNVFILKMADWNFINPYSFAKQFFKPI